MKIDSLKVRSDYFQRVKTRRYIYETVDDKSNIVVGDILIYREVAQERYTGESQAAIVVDLFQCLVNGYKRLTLRRL